MSKASPGQTSSPPTRSPEQRAEAIPNGLDELNQEDFKRLSQSPLLSSVLSLEPAGVIRAMALSFIAFCTIGTIVVSDWPLQTLLMYLLLVVGGTAVFFVTGNNGHLPPLVELGAVALETVLLIASVLVAGLNNSMFFSLLPLYVVVGHIQVRFRMRYALPLSGLIWLILVICIYSSESSGVRTNFVIIALMLTLPLIFTTMTARFMVRESRQHARLVQTLAELQRSEERYRQVTDRANDAIYILDGSGRFSFVNPKMSELSGYAAEELIGKHFTSVLSAQSRTLARERLRNSPARDQNTPDDVVQLELVRRDGAKVTIEVNTSLFTESEIREGQTFATPGRGWVGVARDVTEQQRMRAQMVRRNRDLTALNAVISTATQSLELDKTLNDTVTTLVDVLGADVAGITLIEDETRLLKVGAYKGASDMVVRAVSPGNLKEGEGLTGEVAATGQPMLIGDMTTDQRVTISTVREMGLKAFAAAPIKTRDRILGVLSLISHEENAFTQDDLDLLVSIGNGLAVAIENARLYGTSLNQVRELTCLAEIASAINLSEAQSETLDKIAEIIGNNLGYRGCAIYLVDPEQHMLQGFGTHKLSEKFVKTINEAVTMRDDKHEIEKWPLFQALHSTTPVVTPVSKYWLEGRMNTSLVEVFQTESQQAGWNTVISVPLRLQGQNVGVIGCYSAEKTPPPDSELRLLTTIANQTSLAVQNARLYREQHRRAEQLRAVAELGRKIGSILSVDELLPFITRLLQQTFDYYSVCIFLIDPQDPRSLLLKAFTSWHQDTQVGLRLYMGNQGVIPWVGEHGEPAVLPDVSKDPRYLEYADAGVVRSELTVPIRSGARVVGVLDIASTIPNGFDEVDLATMQAMAEQVSIALDNARLYTELNRIVMQLKSANIELEEATRHKSEFLANMSHELRTPLNAIIGFSELLQDKVFGLLNEKQDRYVNNILVSGRHLLALVNDVLDLAKVEAGRMELHPEDFNPDDAIRDVEAIVNGIATKKKLTISNKFEANLKALRADKSKFKQIMYNLLSNAVKFTLEGGSITVLERLIEKPNNKGGIGAFIEIAVQDTGIGIRKEDQGQIFEEFRQVESSYSRQYQGTGLGLALSRRLIELHGGQVWVESELGQGSTFTFTLPLEMVEVSPSNLGLTPSDPIDRLLEAHAQTRLEKQVAQEVERVAGRSETDFLAPPEISADEKENLEAVATGSVVVVVEDDDNFAELLGLYLSSGGYRMERIRKGDEVLPYLEQMTRLPLLITMDVLLPNKNGWDVLRDLKAQPHLKHIPVMIISLMNNPDLSQRLGATTSLVKPIKKDEFLAAIQRLEAELKEQGLGVEVKGNAK